MHKFPLHRQRTGLALVVGLALIAVVSGLAFGRTNSSKPAPKRFEYLHQEIATAGLTQSLNELDDQGWEVFQVVPIWLIKNENAETTLSPRAYEVFGRRALEPK